MTTFLVTNPLQYIGTSRDRLYAIQFHKHLWNALLSQKAMRTSGNRDRWHKDDYSP